MMILYRIDSACMNGLQAISDKIYEWTLMDSIRQGRIVAVLTLLYLALSASAVPLMLGIWMSILHYFTETDLRANPKNFRKEPNAVPTIGGLLLIGMAGAYIYIHFSLGVPWKELWPGIFGGALFQLWGNIQRLDLQIPENTTSDNDAGDGPTTGQGPLNQGAGA